MAPTDRLIDAYPLLAEFIGEPMSTCHEHMVYICKTIFMNHKEIVARLPFQDKCDPWDIEYALKEIYAYNDRYCCPLFITKVQMKEYGGEMATHLTIKEDGYPYRYNTPISIRRPNGNSSYSPDSRMRLDIDLMRDELNDGDEEQALDGYINIFFETTETITKKVKRKLNVYCGELSGMSEEAIVSYFKTIIDNDDESCTTHRTIRTNNPIYTDIEYSNFETPLIDANGDETDGENVNFTSTSAKEILDYYITAIQENQ